MKLPLDMFYQWEKQQSDKVYLKQAIDGKNIEYTWAEAAVHIRKMASALKAMDLPPKSHIAIASKNCAHWIFADFAIWMSGHVSIPLYPNLTTSMIQKILKHSETKLVFFGKLDDQKQYLDAIPDEMPMICFPHNPPAGKPVWDEVIQKHQQYTGSPSRDLDETATIIYTSGTTGDPKGVMHTFRSFAHASSIIVDDLGLTNQESFFSYLPLAHVAERVLTESLALYCGSSVSFAESLDTFSDNLQEAKATIFLGVPRIWEKFQSGVFQKLPEKKLKRLLSIPGLSFFIKKKIRKALGLNHAKLCLTGAAPISVELLEWYDRLGIRIREAYGLTENLAFSHFNRTGTPHFGSVGTVWETVETQITAEGEVIMKSPAIMQGYFKEKEKTAEVIKDGWFYTGDQGVIDAQGFLKITGRVKDLFKTSKGKYVAPTPIELKLSSDVAVEQVCVVGSEMPQPVALLNLSEQGANISKNSLDSYFSSVLEKLNVQLDAHERLNKIIIIQDVWTTENEFLTPTMKLKRNKVESYYKDKVKAWCSTKDKVILA